jgi:tetratricopeptide (TPR) repeat protein
VTIAPETRNFMKVEAGRILVTPEEVLSVSELFERGKVVFSNNQPAQALTIFERVLAVDPQGVWTEEALYHAARASEDLGDQAAAARRFEDVARRFPTGELARESLLRAIRLRGYLEDWQLAGTAAEVYLERYRDLGPREQLVVIGARALAALAAGRVESAEYFVAKGRQVVEAHRLDSAGTIPKDLAQLYYAQGETRRVRSEEIHFDPLPEDFSDAFERRAQLLIDAQNAYSDAMRAYDAHWTAMAGYRVGELYHRLHDDVVSMPRPKGADTDRRRSLFEAALRMRYAVLLRKGLTMLNHTLAMAERTGEASQWTERAKAAKAEIEVALGREQSAIEALPFSRLELAQVLSQIQARQK